MKILTRIADWLRDSVRDDSREGYKGLTGSEKFEALAMRGSSLGRARQIVAEVEAERAGAKLAEHKPVPEKPE